MKRADAQTLRKCAQQANQLIKFGVAFVCMPVDGEDEYTRRACRKWKMRRKPMKNKR